MLGGLLPRAAAGAAVGKFVGGETIVEFFVKLFSKTPKTMEPLRFRSVGIFFRLAEFVGGPWESL
jgi:hypothetical protein